MWTLGLVMWLFDRDRSITIENLKKKFAAKPEIADANIAAVNAGHAYGETAELPTGIDVYKVPKADVAPGLYRNTTGSDALAFGLLAGGQLANLPITFASYPITPASSLLHTLSQQKHFNVVTFQAEDEIAAVCAAVGASFAGSLGVTSSSGPGITLKGEAISLASSTELPLVIINTQRGGPSTGLPTKTEQSDFNQALYGRHADTMLPVVSASSSVDCFDVAIEACRLAVQFMTPVILLSDGYMANASEPWLVPDITSYKPFPVNFEKETENFTPAKRDPRNACSSLGEARNPRIRAPDRRYRKRYRYRKYLIRFRKSSGYDRLAGAKDRKYCSLYSQTDSEFWTRNRKAGGRGLGLYLRSYSPSGKALSSGKS